MATLNMEEILRQIGWNNGYHIPIANTENQALEAELQKLVLRRNNAKGAYEEATSKFQALDKHFKYMQQEAEQNQKLLTAYVQQVEAERHKYLKLNSEYERVNQDLRHINKNMEEIECRQDDKRKDLARTMDKIEKLKAGTAWDSEALNAWDDSLNKCTGDEELLQKFSKLDDRKAKELDMRRQNLHDELFEKRKVVERVVADIRSYEQMQERTDKLFKQQGEERMALIEHWQNTVKNLRQKDEAIYKVHRKIEEVQELIGKQEEDSALNNAFLETQQDVNKKIQGEISEFNSLSSRFKKELNEVIEYVLDLTNNAATLKRALGTAARKLEKQREESKSQEKQMATITKKFARTCDENKEVEKTLKEIQTSSMSTADKTNNLQQMIDAEETMSKNWLVDNENMQAVLYRNQLVREELVNYAKSVEREVSVVEASNKSLQKQIISTMGEVNMKTETVYNLEYAINEIQVKMSVYETTKLDDEDVIISAKILQLEKELTENSDLKNFLQTQITNLQDELRRLGVAIAADTDRIAALKGKLQGQILLFNGGVKKIASAKLKSQQRQVDENLLRLRVAQLEKAITVEENSIYDLNKFRLELHTSLKERQIEIESHQDILQAKKRNLDEVRGKLKADINHRKIRIEQFQKKHHLALTALGTDEDGQPLSITHFKIKDAQERHQLQQESDDLSNKLQKAEKEIVAMENTLKVVNMTNDAYRKSFMPSEEDDTTQLELNHIEQEICNASVVLKQQKKTFAEKRKELKCLQEDLLVAQQRWEEEHKMLEELENSYLTLKQEQIIREEKIAKTLNDIKTYKSRIMKPNLEKPERNLEIRQLQDANKFALKQLASLIGEHDETAPVILDLLNRYNLELPSSVKDRATPSSSSMASLTGSRRSSGSLSCTALTQVVLTFNDNSKKQ